MERYHTLPAVFPWKTRTDCGKIGAEVVISQSMRLQAACVHGHPTLLGYGYVGLSRAKVRCHLTLQEDTTVSLNFGGLGAHSEEAAPVLMMR